MILIFGNKRLVWIQKSNLTTIAAFIYFDMDAITIWLFDLHQM